MLTPTWTHIANPVVCKLFQLGSGSLIIPDDLVPEKLSRFQQLIRQQSPLQHSTYPLTKKGLPDKRHYRHRNKTNA